MSIGRDINNVKTQIRGIYDRRRAALFALSLRYAGLALQFFRAQQSTGRYWENQTNTALNAMFSDAFQSGDVVGWFLAHGVQYGVYLELANDRRHEAIRPIVAMFAPRFIQDVKELFGDR